MGHVRLGNLHRTRRWQDVVGLHEHGAAADQVANAAIHAAEAGLRLAPKDRGVRDTVWLLMHLPAAARADDYPAALADCGVRVDGPPSLMALAGAFADAVDARLP